MRMRALKLITLKGRVLGGVRVVSVLRVITVIYDWYD
jgi:hypothetical protein